MYAAGENIKIQAQDAGNTDLQIRYACQPQEGECAGHGKDRAKDFTGHFFALDAAVQQRRTNGKDHDAHHKAAAHKAQHGSRDGCQRRID